LDGTTDFALYQQEVVCYSLTIDSTVEGSVEDMSEQTAASIELDGKHLFVWLNAHIHNNVLQVVIMQIWELCRKVGRENKSEEQFSNTQARCLQSA